MVSVWTLMRSALVTQQRIDMQRFPSKIPSSSKTPSDYTIIILVQSRFFSNWILANCRISSRSSEHSTMLIITTWVLLGCRTAKPAITNDDTIQSEDQTTDLDG